MPNVNIEKFILGKSKGSVELELTPNQWQQVLQTQQSWNASSNDVYYTFSSGEDSVTLPARQVQNTLGDGFFYRLAGEFNTLRQPMSR